MTKTDERLAELAREANEAHAQAQASYQRGVDHAIRAGKALARAKKRVPHGQWGAWLAENFEGSERSAQLYMRMARRTFQLDDETRNAVAEMALRDAAKVVAEPRTVRVHSRIVDSPSMRIVVNKTDPDVLPAPTIESSHESGPVSGGRTIESTDASRHRQRPPELCDNRPREATALAQGLVELVNRTGLARPTDIARAFASNAKLDPSDLEELVCWLSRVASELDQMLKGQRCGNTG